MAAAVIEESLAVKENKDRHSQTGCSSPSITRAWTIGSALRFMSEEICSSLMRPCPDEWLSAVEVSPLVNSPKNDTPEVVQPAIAVEATVMPQGRLFAD